VFSPPAGTTATSGTAIESAKYNAFVSDLTTDANTARPIVAGGTGATTAGAALTALGAQPADAELTAIAGLTSAADRLPYFTGSGTAALATFTAAGRALVDDANAAAQLTTLGIGGDIPALEALASTGIAVRTAADTWATRTVTSADSSVTITNPGGVAGNIDLSASTQWTLVETLDCTSGTTKETATFEAGKDYLFVLQGVSHDNGASQTLQIAFFGATAAAYTSATSFTDGLTASNFEYGEYFLNAPMRSTKTHTFMGQSFRTSAANTTDQTINLTAGRFGAMCNYNTAQSISKVRFSVSAGANFDSGSILVYKR
jgi:hypothetical protein